MNYITNNKPNHYNSKYQWNIPQSDRWYMTTNLEEAIMEYIGEVYITPTILFNAIRVVLGKQPIKSQLVYYYGKPDEALSYKFGYTNIDPKTLPPYNVSMVKGLKQ